MKRIRNKIRYIVDIKAYWDLVLECTDGWGDHKGWSMSRRFTAEGPVTPTTAGYTFISRTAGAFFRTARGSHLILVRETTLNSRVPRTWRYEQL